MRLVYLSPVPWASFAQRPHKFVEWFHGRANCRALWVDPYPTRLPMLADYRWRMSKRDSSKVEIPNWLTVLQPRALPIEPLPASGMVNQLFWGKLLETVAAFAAQGQCQVGIGKPSELALLVMERIPSAFSFYDAMDDFPAFYSGLSRISMRRREREIANRVRKILVSSSKLKIRFQRYGKKAILASNACSVEGLPPAEMLPLQSSRAVLGYVGTIGHWFDWSLVITLAHQYPSATLRIIGPVYTRQPEHLPKNIEILPPCSHEAAIHAMLHFSAGLIPFKKNVLTSSVDPIKYYEYRAIGLPVISTSFGEMAYRHSEPGVFFLDDVTDLKRVVEAALHFRFEAHEILAFRAANRWDARFDASGLLP